MIEAAGSEVVERPDDADVARVQLVRGDGGRRGGPAPGACARGARATPALRSVVMGCAAARDARATIARAADGAGDRARRRPRRDRRGRSGSRPAARGAARRTQTGARALLRIQDGCDEHCTFCATTLARGAHAAAAGRRLVREAERARRASSARSCSRESTSGRYGARLRVVARAALVSGWCGGCRGVRFRLSSVEATEVDERLGELLTAAPAPRGAAPPRAAAVRVRPRAASAWDGTGTPPRSTPRPSSGIAARARDVRASAPTSSPDSPARRTTITPPPSRWSGQLPFTYLHVFPYSARPGTAAARLPQARCRPCARARARGGAARARRDARPRRIARGAPAARADVVVVAAGARRARAHGGLPRRRASSGEHGRAPRRRARGGHATADSADGSLVAHGASPDDRTVNPMPSDVRGPRSTSRPTAAR